MRFDNLHVTDMDTGAKKIEVAVSREAVSSLLDEFYSTIAEYFGMPADTPGRQVEEGIAASGNAAGIAELKRDFVMNRITSGALAELDLMPMLTPNVHVDDYPEYENGFSYELSIVERPELSLESCDPVEIEMERIEADDEYVARRLAMYLQPYDTYEPVPDHPLKLGDFAEVNLTTLVDGKAKANLSGMGMILPVSYDAMPKPFIDQILGMEVGETRGVDYVMPRERAIADDDVEQYEASITVLGLKEPKQVELTDEWVKEHVEGVRTVDEFLLGFREDVENEVKAYNRDTLAHLANVELEKRLVGTIPDEFYRVSLDKQMDKMGVELKQQGKTFDDYYEENHTNQEELSVKLLVKAGEGLKQSFALETLFDMRQMQLDASDLEDAFHHLFGSKDYDESALKQSGRFHLVESAAKRMKAIAWLVETAHVTYVAPGGMV